MLLRTGDFVTFAANGGRAFDASLPLAVFLHGAGLDHSVWALHSRWFAHNGWSVLAPDLPGHGRSGGQPLASIEADGGLASPVDRGRWCWAGEAYRPFPGLARRTRNRRAPSRQSLGPRLDRRGGHNAGIAALLAAAEAGDHAAIDMVSIWGHGFRAGLGGSQVPGLWMLGAAGRLLERARPGVLFADLSACNNYKGGLEAAARISVPVTLVLGERDLMTPLKAGRALGAALPNARVVVLPGAGHMLMAERPDEVLKALTAA